MIKSVQRGRTNIGKNNTIDVTISEVDLSKSFVNIQPFIIGNDSKIQDPDNYAASGRLTSSTTLKLYQYYGAFDYFYVAWEVIEFA